jgi:hypothetical protein
MVFGGKLKLLADAVVFRHRGLLEGAFGTLENAARISQGFVQEQGVKVIAQVVVSRDVGAAAFPRVFAEKVIGLVKGGFEPGQAPVESPENYFIEENNPEEDRQVIGRPVACHVSLPCADGTPKKNLGVKARMKDADRGTEVAFFRPSAKNMLFLPYFEDKFSELNPSKKGK